MCLPAKIERVKSFVAKCVWSFGVTPNLNDIFFLPLFRVIHGDCLHVGFGVGVIFVSEKAHKTTG